MTTNVLLLLFDSKVKRPRYSKSQFDQGGLCHHHYHHQKESENMITMIENSRVNILYYFLNRQKGKREFFFWPCVSRRDLLRVRHVCVLCIISCLLFLIGRFLFDKTQFVPPPFRLPTASLYTFFFLSWIEIGRLLLPFDGGRVWWLHS